MQETTTTARNSNQTATEKVTERLFSRSAVPYYFLIPFFAIWVVFYLYPIFWAVWMSFNEFGFQGSSFVGAQHYVRILSGQGNFLTSLFNTGLITAMVVPTQIAVALVFATLLDSGFTKFRKIQRAGYLLPMVTSTAVMASLFGLFLDSTGLLNQVLSSLAGVQYNWLSQPFLAKVSVALTHGWRTTGLFIVIYLAGLQNIPEQLYRAAAIDGANRIQQFRYITVPQLRPITMLVTILATFRAVQLFDVPFVLTQGGPGFSSTTVVMLLFQEAFQNINLGYAAAIAVVYTVIVGTLYIIQFKIGGRNDE